MSQFSDRWLGYKSRNEICNLPERFLMPKVVPLVSVQFAGMEKAQIDFLWQKIRSKFKDAHMTPNFRPTLVQGEVILID